MANGKWQTVVGRWQTVVGRWPMADGRWPMADGRWPMADGRWPMADGRWPMADGRAPTGERLPIFAVPTLKHEEKGARRPLPWSPGRIGENVFSWVARTRKLGSENVTLMPSCQAYLSARI